MGLYYEYITGYLYSISEDKFFKVYDVSQKGIIAGTNFQFPLLTNIEVLVGNFPLTKLVVQKTAKRAFVGNKKGHIFIYDISPVNIFLLSK